MRQIAPKATTTSFRSMPDNVYVSGGEYFVKGTSRTGQPVSAYVDDTDENEEVLYDESGQAYILDPETGEKIYVSVDPTTGAVTRLPSTDTTETPDDPATTPNDPTGDPNNPTTDPSGGQNPSSPNVDPSTPSTDPGVVDPTPNPGGDTPNPNPNPPGVIDDRRRR